MIDNVPISFDQPLFRDRCQAAHIAHTVSNGSVECNYGGWMVTEGRALKSPILWRDVLTCGQFDQTTIKEGSPDRVKQQG